MLRMSIFSMYMYPVGKFSVIMACFLFLLTCSTRKSEGDAYEAACQQMIKKDIQGRGINDERVLQAMQKVKRHLFVPDSYRSMAYADRPLPIGEGQTISQPYIVALMTYHLHLKPEDKVLEIGTGSGYQAAVLAELAKEVYSIEIVEQLAQTAEERLKAMGYKNVWVKCGDGFYGWAEHAPYDAIIITCAAPLIPERLVEQLREGGRMILPLGDEPFQQSLTVLTKRGGKIEKQRITEVVFVPMTGAIGGEKK
jgi:protein-L-isoaspartate(D-aspartate) O-methyltransferase